MALAVAVLIGLTVLGGWAFLGRFLLGLMIGAALLAVLIAAASLAGQ